MRLKNSLVVATLSLIAGVIKCSDMAPQMAPVEMPQQIQSNGVSQMPSVLAPQQLSSAPMPPQMQSAPMPPPDPQFASAPMPPPDPQFTSAPMPPPDPQFASNPMPPPSINAPQFEQPQMTAPLPVNPQPMPPPVNQIQQFNAQQPAAALRDGLIDVFKGAAKDAAKYKIYNTLIGKNPYEYGVYRQPSYPSYPNNPSYSSYPGYPSYANNPGYPSYASNPSYPSYASYPIANQMTASAVQPVINSYNRPTCVPCNQLQPKQLHYNDFNNYPHHGEHRHYPDYSMGLTL